MTSPAPARSPRIARKRSTAGFSLIEILVAIALLSILAGAGAAVSLRTLRGNLAEKTVKRMRAVTTAMIGDSERGTSGYLGDMGELPDSNTLLLRQLFEPGAPAGTADAIDGIMSGYNGPYIIEGTENGVGIRDAWGTPLVYTPGIMQLTSLGPDRQPGGGDDITIPAVPPVLAGTVTVIVKGLLVGGGLPVALDSTEAQVTVSYTRSSDNQRTTTTAAYMGGGVWRTNGPSPSPSGALHLGDHAVLVTGQDGTRSGGRDFSGAVAREIVHIDRSSVHVTVLLDQN